tara:strand:+ start:273 stop:1616 length:1344 start_codon:yes stop_codon:yes gene_type:complete
MDEQFYGVTTTQPAGIAILIVCVIATLAVPRKWAAFPLVILMMAIPSAQRFVVADLDFNFIRLVVITGFLRVLIRKEYLGFQIQLPDKAVVLWMIWAIIAFTMLREGFSGFITRSGYMLEAVGCYFLGRVYLRDMFDLRRLIVLMGIASIPMVCVFLFERFNGRNLFAQFGGVPEFTKVRQGRLRCQGPFSHPILAGIFWANIVPWLGAMWFTRAIPRTMLAFYIVCILGIIVNTASSTPIMSLIFSVIGFIFYFYRRYMNYVRWGLVTMAITLHLVMEAPVWHLISRVNVVGGSTGWHRFHLMDKAVENFWEWWAIGVESTAHWGWGLFDVTNQYVLEGVRGGILGLILYVFFLGSIFWLLGKAMRHANSKAELIILWASGTMVFVNVAGFFAVSYFGQTESAFFLFLGISVSLATTAIQTRRAKMREEAAQESISGPDPAPSMNR